MEDNLKEGQIVLCTVKKILGTTVFVQIENNGEGTLTTSEISPGRIRNLRNYVTPGKKIACKVLRVDNKQIHLSLRRVKTAERKELLDKIAKEKSYKAILKTALGKDKAKETIEKITQDYTLLNFFEESKKDPKIIEKYIDKKNSEKILKILNTKKTKEKEIKKTFILSSKAPNGINTIKSIIKEASKASNTKISYIAAGKYSILIKGEKLKELDTKLTNILEEIKTLAKKQNCEFKLK